MRCFSVVTVNDTIRNVYCKSRVRSHFSKCTIGTLVPMNFKKNDRNRLFFEACAIAIGFTIGFALWYATLSSRVGQMAFNERFCDAKIYPDFMKSVWIMGINSGVWYAVCGYAIVQLFFHRISDIASSVRMVLIVFFSFLLLSSAIRLIALCFYSDTQFYVCFCLLWLMPWIAVVVSTINIIYILCSFSSSEGRNRFLTLPNCLCSIGLFSLILPTWLHILDMYYMPLWMAYPPNQPLLIIPMHMVSLYEIRRLFFHSELYCA